ncbi:MAG: M6 family metalloprotease domain-containing protein, partial [Bacteroidales bacterium]|nr:M6 family metalloprotease domain-containing protein [Bacteroidales bacterium]
MRKSLASILLLAGILAGAQPREGEVHIPVILLEFSDVHFTLEDPAGHFTELLNGSRSVREYYRDNSGGRYEPVFDIYGPVRLGKKMAWYGKDVYSGGVRVDDMRPEQALLDACGMLDEEVDFSLYDQDADGIIDLCIYYFAGYDQAQGGPADALWAHHWNIRDSEQETIREISFDGVRPGSYFCGSELSGGSGNKPSGIGPTCHELGHTLNLPDFYDVNGAADGFAGGLYDFSLMCRGLYNNDGHTPPHLNALERYLLGWWEDIPELPEGEVVLEAVRKGRAYRISTQTEGEFFLLETRDGTSWDHPLPEGLVIYHVDRSERLVGEFPAVELWTDWRAHNILNGSGSHPCFYLIPSADPTSLNYPSAFNASALVFPGSVKRLSFDPVDWEGNFTDTQLTTIEFQDGKATFRVLKGKGAHIDGVVRNSAGKPVADATVALEGFS